MSAEFSKLANGISAQRGDSGIPCRRGLQNAVRLLVLLAGGAVALHCGGRSPGDRGDSGIVGSGSPQILAPENTDYGGTSGPGIIYTFVGWDASSIPGQYPSQMAIRCTSVADPNLAATVSGSYTGHTNNSATGFGARGEGMGGISVLSTGTANSICSYDGGTNPGYIAAIDVGPFDTTGVTGLRVFFEAAQTSDEAREYGLRLQYSTDGGTTFTDAPGPVEFKSDSVGASTAYRHFGPMALSAIDNQTQVVLRWRYYYISGSSGNRTRIALRNIRVSTDATNPSAPTALTATALSSSSIRLDWTHATDAVTTGNYMRYDIYQATSSGGQNFSLPSFTVRGTNTATISGLTSSTTYYYVVRARDEQGNREMNSVEVSATTTADTTPPSVLSFNPANGAVYSTVGPVSVTFDKPMNPATVTTSSLKLVTGTDCAAAGIAASSITPSMGNTVFTINFTATKNDGQQYTTCVSTAVQSAAGVALLAPASATWTATDIIYSTGYETGFSKTGYAAGLTGPGGGQWNLDDALIGTTGGSDRFNGAQSVRFNSSNANSNSSTCNAQGGMCAEMDFDVYGAQQVRFLCARYGSDADGTVKLQASTDAGASWSDVGSSQSCAGTSLTMKSINASYGTANARFRIVKLTGGRLNIDDFEVRAAPAPPSVIASSPANGATSVAFNPSVSVTFSEAMNITTVNSAYTVRQTNCSGAVVSSGTPTASGGDTIFTYSVTGLAPNTQYAVCVTTGAQNVGGTPIAAAFSATFTTAALAEPTSVVFTPGNSQVTIGWTNSSNANAGVKIVRATGSAPTDCNSGTTVCSAASCNANLAPSAAGLSYTDTGLTNGTAYYYRVCANHTGPAALSAGVTGNATPNNAFNVTGASSTSNTTVMVTYNAAPTPGGGGSGAENAANYKIVAGADPCTAAAVLSVSAASLSGMTVTLTTAAQSATSYKLCVSNVTRNSDSAPLATDNATFTGTGGGLTLIYSENFEGCTKTGYAAGTPTGCTSGNSWNMDDALIGTSGSDRFNGTRSARLNSTNANTNASPCNADGGMCVEMGANVSGAQEVRFYCAKYGSDTTDGIIQLQASTDGGTTWSNQGATVTCSGAALVQHIRSVSFPSTPVRFRWIKTNGVSTSRTNIDDIEIYN
ncbi:MAG: hypothetical protein OHK0011_00730 [Turneriella sp.]